MQCIMGLGEKILGLQQYGSQRMGWFITDVAKCWVEQSVMSEAEDVGGLCAP